MTSDSQENYLECYRGYTASLLIREGNVVVVI